MKDNKNNNSNKINIRKTSKRSTRKECNDSEINETEALMNQLNLLSFSEDKSFEDQTLFQKSRSNYKHGTKELLNNFYSNNQPNNIIPEEKEKRINNNHNENIEYNDRKEILKLKLDNILTTLKLSDIKINNKYYCSIFKFKDYFRDNILILNYYSHFNDLFDIIIELLFVIKKENEKNEMNNNKNNKNGIILKLEKEINFKEKQIGELLNKLKIEQEKVEKNSKENCNELNMLKKENKELCYQLSLYKNHIKKLDSNNLILEEKINNIIFEKINKRSLSVNNRVIHDKNNKTINMNNNININNFNGIIPSTPPNLEIINFNESNKNFKKNNKEDNNMRKLNLNLINLLEEINKILSVYDLSLNKVIIDERQKNAITNLNNMIDYNILNNNDKMEKFHKTFLGNMDKILCKLDILIEKNKKKLNKKQKDSININIETKKCLSSYKRNHKKSQEIKSFILKTEEKPNNKIMVNRKNFIDIKNKK